MSPLSPRLQAALDALPLRSGLRVLELGCGPGALLRAIAHRVEPGFALGVDRSASAVAAARAGSSDELAAGMLDVRCSAIEDLVLEPGEAPFDLAVALRVGALDGRHPDLELRALRRIADALVADAPLYLDGGDPLRIVPLPR